MAVSQISLDLPSKVKMGLEMAELQQ